MNYSTTVICDTAEALSSDPQHLNEAAGCHMVKIKENTTCSSLV